MNLTVFNIYIYREVLSDQTSINVDIYIHCHPDQDKTVTEDRWMDTNLEKW